MTRIVKYQTVAILAVLLTGAAGYFFLLRNETLPVSRDGENGEKKAEEKALPEIAVDAPVDAEDYGCEDDGQEGRIYFVSPEGRDSGAGTSESDPWKTIQKAVDSALPGDTVELLSGEYFQDIVSKADGKSGARITIHGAPDAVLRGGGKDRVIEINHDFITLDGFTLDGLFDEGRKEKGYRDKLVYLLGKEKKEGVSGFCMRNMTIQNAGGECVRLRYFAVKNEISNNKITRCGAFDFKFDGGGKNGEGIYIGTAPEQSDDGKNATDGPDHSNENWIHHNVIDTQGNECVDIKEGSSGNIIEHNSCTGQKDPESGGMDSRGSANIFRYNEIVGSVGAGIRLGGDSKTDGTNNTVFANKILRSREGAVKIMREPQGKICENELADNKKDCVGECPKKFDPAAKCK